MKLDLFYVIGWTRMRSVMRRVGVLPFSILLVVGAGVIYVALQDTAADTWRHSLFERWGTVAAIGLIMVLLIVFILGQLGSPFRVSSSEALWLMRSPHGTRAQLMWDLTLAPGRVVLTSGTWAIGAALLHSIPLRYVIPFVVAATTLQATARLVSHSGELLYTRMSSAGSRLVTGGVAAVCVTAILLPPTRSLTLGPIEQHVVAPLLLPIGSVAPGASQVVMVAIVLAATSVVFMLTSSRQTGRAYALALEMDLLREGLFARRRRRSHHANAIAAPAFVVGSWVFAWRSLVAWKRRFSNDRGLLLAITATSLATALVNRDATVFAGFVWLGVVLFGALADTHIEDMTVGVERIPFNKGLTLLGLIVGPVTRTVAYGFVPIVIIAVSNPPWFPSLVYILLLPPAALLAVSAAGATKESRTLFFRVLTFAVLLTVGIVLGPAMWLAYHPDDSGIGAVLPGLVGTLAIAAPLLWLTAARLWPGSVPQPQRTRC